MIKKSFTTNLIFIFLVLFSVNFNYTYAGHQHCKVNFCNCCHTSGNGAFYDIYNFANDFYEGGFLIDSAGDCTPGLNLWNDSTYYVTTSCHGKTLNQIVFFTPCVCRGTDTVHIPCCPTGDGTNSQDSPSNFAPPKKFTLHQNFPNPFNPSTQIKFDTPVEGNVKLSVFDINGKEVEVLLNGFTKAGYHEITWSAINVSSGIYFYKIETATFTDRKKMVVIK